MSNREKILIWGGIFLVVFIPQYIVSFNARNDSIESCERINVFREQFIGLLDDLIESNTIRIKAKGSSPSEVEANKIARENYSNRKKKLINSITYPSEDDRTEINCEQAFPKPFPFN